MPSALVGLYGLFAILYRDHGGGDTYVKLGGRQMDASTVGVIAVIVALVGVGISLGLMKGRGRVTI